MSGDSLIDLETPPADDDKNTQTPSAAKDGDEGEYDPSADLESLKDGESGLYLGKYKTLADFADGYKSLTAKLREKTPEPPAKPGDYKFEFANEAFKDFQIKDDDPMWAVMGPALIEAGVPNDKAQLLVERFLEFNEGIKPDLAAEKKKLGADADKIIGSVKNYALQRKTEDAELLTRLAGQDAGALKELNLLIQASGERKLPKLDDAPTGGKSFEELRQEAFDYREKHKESFDTDPKKQQIYEGLWEKALAAKKR